MIRTLEIKIDDNFEKCEDCINFRDATAICMARGCIHAIPRGYIKDCYKPKESEGNNGHYQVD